MSSRLVPSCASPTVYWPACTLPASLPRFSPPPSQLLKILFISAAGLPAPALSARAHFSPIISAAFPLANLLPHPLSLVCSCNLINCDIQFITH